MSHNVENGFSAGDEKIRNDAAVTSPPHCLRTHYRTALLASLLEQLLQTSVKGFRKRIVGIVMEAFSRPEAIHIRGNASRLAAKASEGCDMFVGNLECRERTGKRVDVELWISFGLDREFSDVRHKANIGCNQQSAKLFQTPVGMADREEWMLHRCA